MLNPSSQLSGLPCNDARPSVGVMRLSALGDIALTLPLLRAMVVRPVVVTSSSAKSLLCDEFDDFILLPSKRARDIWSLIRQLRARRLDFLIDLQDNDRSRLIRTLCGARHCPYTDNRRLFALPAFERARRAFDNTGLLGPLDINFRPKPRDYIVLNAGSSARWISKRLPDAVWRRIANSLRERFALPFVLTGSPDEADYIAHVADVVGAPVENRAGQTSLLELKRVLAHAFLVVSTDSGAMHIAAAMKTPTIGIFGATNWLLAAPFGPWSTVVYDRVFYHEGQPPERHCQQCLPCYDHIDIQDGLRAIAAYLSPS